MMRFEFDAMRCPAEALSAMVLFDRIWRTRTLKLICADESFGLNSCGSLFDACMDTGMLSSILNLFFLMILVQQ